jgi:hypothetical protein
MYIAEITERLLEVNRLLLKYIKDTELTFEENLVFSGFYHDYKDINSIINSAEKELNDSPAILMEQAKALAAAASDFLATYESHEDIFESYNPQPVCDRYIKPLEKEYDSIAYSASQLWKQYSQMSVRMDYLNPEDDDYKDIEKESEEVKARYEAAKAKSDETYRFYTAEREKTAKLYFFEMIYLEMLVVRMKRIADSIIKDIEELKSEGKI